MRFLGVMVVVFAFTSSAHADDRYAEQTLAADAFAIGLVIGGHQSDHQLTRNSGIVLGFGAAPLLHLAHGNNRGAVKSLFLKTMLPLATTFLGSKMAARRLCFTPIDTERPDGLGCHEEEERMEGATMMGLLLGMTAASILDATFLAKTPTVRTEWVPNIAITRDGMQASVGTTF